MHHETNQLFIEGNVARSRLALGDVGADVDVPDRPSTRLRERERDHVGGAIVSLVPGVQPAHRLAAEKGHRDGSLPTLTAQDRLHHPAYPAGCEGQPAA